MRAGSIVEWLVRGTVGVTVLAALLAGIGYVLGGSLIAREFPRATYDIDVPTDPASVAEGARLASLRGCNAGCHGPGTEGNVMVAMVDGTRLVAPDLGRLARRYSNAELERIIRRGLRPNGTSLIAMPSAMFQHLSDEDLGRIIAFLRSRPAAGEALPDRRFGPLGRLFAVFFSLSPGRTLHAADSVDHGASPLPTTPSEPFTFGRYLALSICSECHGAGLRGENGGIDLAVVAGYSRGDFRALLRTGIASGNRELRLMKEVAVRRFSHLTDEEIDAVHLYLQTLAGQSGGAGR
jgi:mono/diheme cytochrome c family protein